MRQRHEMDSGLPELSEPVTAGAARVEGCRSSLSTGQGLQARRETGIADAATVGGLRLLDRLGLVAALGHGLLLDVMAAGAEGCRCCKSSVKQRLLEQRVAGAAGAVLDARRRTRMQPGFASGVGSLELLVVGAVCNRIQG